MMMKFKQKIEIPLLTGALWLLTTISWAQGDFCADPIDLTGNFVVNGRYTYDVDNTGGSQFFKVTVPQDGWLEMTTCTVGYQHNTYLKVYADDCSLVTETGMGCSHQAGHDLEVTAGETYIFEWSDQELQVPHYLGLNAYQYKAQLIFHETVSGQSCDSPKTMFVGSNFVDYWFDDQYFTYTATSNGILEVSTCNIDNAYNLPYNGEDDYGFKIFDECEGLSLGSSSFDCDEPNDWENNWKAITYYMTKDEQVILQMPVRYHERYDYNFNMIFTEEGNNCELPISISSGIHDVDNSNGDQWYEFTAPKSGPAVVTTGIRSSAVIAKNLNKKPGPNSAGFKDTEIEIYEVCGGTIWKFNTDYGGLFEGASEINHSYTGLSFTEGTTYYIRLVDDPNDLESQKGGQYQFELFYEEDLIVGTEETPLPVSIGVNEDYGNLYYVTEQWFEYEFTSNGIFTMQLAEYSSPVIYSANDVVYSAPDDESADDSFTFDAEDGDVLIFSLSGKDQNNTFTASFNEEDSPCDLAMPISISTGIHDVDNSNGDQWYKFTAPKSGPAVVTTGIRSSAVIAKNLNKKPGPNSAGFKDTEIEIYEVCGGAIWKFNTDYGGLFEGASEINHSYTGLSFTEGSTYYIRLVDDPNDLESQKGGQYQFELFYEEDLIVGTEEIPLLVSIGLNEDYGNLYYVTEQWFEYEFASNGIFTMQLAEYSSPVIYSANDVVYSAPDDESADDSFTFDAEDGDVLIFSLSGKDQNNTFTASFVESRCNGAYTQLDNSDMGDDVSVDNTLGNHIFRYTATMDGTLFLSTCNQNNDVDTYVKLYELCSENILAESDDFCGDASRISFPVANGTTYEIVWDDANMLTGTSVPEFEFYFDYLENIPGKVQEDAIEIDEGLFLTHTQYLEEQWFSYTLSTNGVLNVAGFPGPEDNFNSLLMVTSSGGVINLIDPINATYTGIAGDEVFIVWNGNFDYSGIEFDVFFTSDDDSCMDINSLSTSVCNSYIFDGNVLTKTGQYNANFQNALSCDSLVILNLTILESASGTESISTCDSYDWEGTTYTVSGDYTSTLINAVGCDSLATLNLTILESASGNESISTCDSYDWEGTIYTTSGDYTTTLANAVGCDSLATLNLTILEATSSTESISTCDSYDWEGTTYTATGDYTVTLTNAVGCDSLATLNLTILESSSGSESVSTCETYNWEGTNYTATGDYTATLTNAVGCDSLATLNLTILESTSGTESISTCETYDWEGTTYTATGDYTVTLTNVVGCDSLATLNLTILESTSGIESISTCESYDWEGTTYTATGDYTVTLTNAVGCDSLATLNLTILESSSGSESVSTCETYNWEGTIYTATGDYTATLTNAVGCDSLATLNLTILESTSGTESISTCESYDWEGAIYTTSGDYSATLTNEVGCDSLATLNLTILESTSGNETVSTCESYDWEGSSYTVSGDYTATLTNSVGCDSLATLNLTILESTAGSESVSTCETYDWEGSTYTASGDYTATLTNAAGCDSLATLNLTINDSNIVTETVSICGSYEFDGNTITTSGTFEASLLNQNGCDSLVTLNLTVLESDVQTTVLDGCGNYQFGTQLLTASGVYEENFTNQAGCDSLVNLTFEHLTEPSAEVTVNGIVLFAEQKGNVTYQWMDCTTGEPMDGETKRQLTPPGVGNYAVEVSNGVCTVTSECQEANLILSGEESTNHEMTIYPTLTSGQITIDLNGHFEDVDVWIRSLNGQQILHKQYNAISRQELMIDAPNGMYIIQIAINKELLSTDRIIKTQ